MARGAAGRPFRSVGGATLAANGLKNGVAAVSASNRAGVHLTGEAWAVLAGVALTVLLNWALFSYYSGRLWERVRNLSLELIELRKWVANLARVKDDHEKRLSRVEGEMRLKRERHDI